MVVGGAGIARADRGEREILIFLFLLFYCCYGIPQIGQFINHVSLFGSWLWTVQDQGVTFGVGISGAS